MVYQLPNNVIDIKVCSISFQRHSTSVVNRRNKNINTLYKRPNMADNIDRQPLPVVELRPFSKKVWRREKSFPDFYDKKPSEEVNSNLIINSRESENNPTSSRLIRDLTDLKKNIESRQNTFDSALGKNRNHPKAEFQHESARDWRKQDLIPSFITRFERTKTSLESWSRDNTVHRINLERPPSLFENAHILDSNSEMKINGGRMNKKIQRRHLLYLNPLESYRQPNSWTPNFNSSLPSRRKSTNRDRYFNSRNSFPLTSQKRDLILGDAQVHHPLKPIRREDTDSPHKFNSKLGAAKNSLEVLSKVGNPTKLEKNIEKEMEMNLEKFRKDRVLIPNEFKGLQFHCLNFDANLTVGELSLRNAREANKPGKGNRKRQVYGNKIHSVMSGDLSRSNNGLHNATYDNDTVRSRILNSSMVNPILHPIVGHPLVEENEVRSVLDHDIIGPQIITTLDTEKISKHFQNEIPTDFDVRTRTEKSRNSEHNLTRVSESKKKDDISHTAEASTSIETPKLILNSDVMRKSSIDIDNNPSSKSQNQVIDSSRIETNVAYIENLQLKSDLGNHSSSDVDSSRNQTRDDQTDPNIKLNGETDSQQRHSSYNSDQSSSERNRLSPQNSTKTTQNEPSSALQQIPAVSRDNQSQPASGKSNEKCSTNEYSEQSRLHDVDASNEECTENSVRPTVSAGVDSSITITKDLEKDTSNTVAQENSQQRAEMINTSPLTSSGFESQPTTDHEDELPGFDENLIGDRIITEESHDCKNGGDEDNTPHTSHSTASILDNLNNVSESHAHASDKSGNMKPNPRQTNDNLTPANNHGEQNVISNENGTKVTEKSISSPRVGMKRVTQYSPSEDEGISLAPADVPTLLGSPNAEISSDKEPHTGCTDNGDSGVSTTFLTSEDSAAPVIEAIMSS